MSSEGKTEEGKMPLPQAEPRLEINLTKPQAEPTERKFKGVPGNKPDPRFKEVDIPFSKENFPADEKVIENGKLYKVSSEFYVRADTLEKAQEALKEARKAEAGFSSMNQLTRAFIRKASITEVSDNK